MGYWKRVIEGGMGRAPGYTSGRKSMMRVTGLFFDSDAVLRATNRATRQVLGRFGAFVRQRAKSSLRPARQQSISEMSPEQRQRYQRAKAYAARKGLTRLRRPDAISKPGQPPRLHIRPLSRNPLRRLIFFGFDRARQSVVIGPLPFKGMGAQYLEHGGGGYKARPFMAPAMAQELPGLPKLWRDSVKGW